MIADSFKFKGHDCFKDHWSGFDKFKPINVIIGRNNTGKSQLLDILSKLTSHTVEGLELAFRCSGVFDEDSLHPVFSSRSSGGDLPGRMDHWNGHGVLFVDQSIEWQCVSKGSEIEAVNIDKTSEPWAFAATERLSRLSPILKSATVPIHGFLFHRMLADRDIQPEKAQTGLNLLPDGTGATNIIRRLILSNRPEMREGLIQQDLLSALSQIFGEDGDFKGIELRHDEGTEHWEVYLEEPEKGLVALSRSGSGLKTVILVLLNLLVIPEILSEEKSKFIFAFEELENNLHPALLRRLFAYLADFVEREKCQLYLTTHSSVALDFFGPRDDTQIIHVTHDGKSASTKTIAAHFDHVGLLTELGARPSDLLQANGVIWLEGPSDRHYFNRFIELFSNGELREGRDYQCAFYGGSNLANCTFSDPKESDDTLTNLLRLNNNIAVICDGDRTADTGKGSRIKGRVQQIKHEVEKIPSAFLWITEAKEIENYIPSSVWGEVYGLSKIPDPAKYDTFPSGKSKDENFVRKELGRKSFDKCDFAMKAVNYLTLESIENRFELKNKMTELVERIRMWNK